MLKHENIQKVPIFNILLIHISSFVYGSWVLLKNLIKLLLYRKGSKNPHSRDNPPSCLVDSLLGQHKYVKLQGVKFHYVEAGPKDQSMILFLHGFPDCWLTWRYQIPVFAEDFRVIALDLKGFGDSDKPRWRSSYKIEIIIEELKQFILSLGVEKCILVGHDLGALIGWYLVHLEPNLVSKFFAVSCPHPNVYWRSFKNNFKWLNFVQVPFLPEMDALKEDIKLITEYHKHLPSNDVYLEACKYAFSRQEDWTGPLNYYRNLLCSRIHENSDLIQPSVILITGNEDTLFKLEGIVKSTEFCDNFYINMLEDVEHFPHQECPESFNKILLKHLKKRDLKNTDSPTKGLMKSFFGAVSNTVKYGNLVVESVHERASGVVGNISAVTTLPFQFLSRSDMPF